MLYWPAKGPTEVADYGFDFSDALAEGEAIASRTVTGDGVTVDTSAIDGVGVTAWLSGGTAGTVAKVTCTIVTDSTPPRTFSEVAVLEIGGTAVSVARAKEWLKVEGADEDALIDGLVRAATLHIEKVTGKKLVERVVSQELKGFPPDANRPAVRLWYGPVAEILSVDYDDGDGAVQAVADFRLAGGSSAQLLPAYGEAWPVAQDAGGSVRIRYVAGYGPTDLDRAQLEQAVLMLVAHWYQNREAVGDGAMTELPLGVSALIAPFMSVGLG